MIHIISIGKSKHSAAYNGLGTLCTDYIKRIQAWCPVQVTELPESPLSQPKQAQDDETKTLRPWLQKSGQRLLWTEHGQLFDSVQWAGFIQRQREHHGFSAANPWIWILAGPHGPSEQLQQACQHKVSLSPMTFPHLLARLLVLEQLYRGLAIQHNSGYHK